MHGVCTCRGWKGGFRGLAPDGHAVTQHRMHAMQSQACSSACGPVRQAPTAWHTLGPSTPLQLVLLRYGQLVGRGVQGCDELVVAACTQDVGADIVGFKQSSRAAQARDAEADVVPQEPKVRGIAGVRRHGLRRDTKDNGRL